jgi:hypothetical protein
MYRSLNRWTIYPDVHRDSIQRVIVRFLCRALMLDKGISMKKIALLLISLAAVTGLLSGCGGGGVAKTSQFRVVHASPDAPSVDVLASGETLLRNVPYAAISGYQTVAAGTTRVQVNGTGTTASAINAQVYLDPAQKRTIVAVGRLASIEPLVLVDDASAPSAGQIKLRLVHASPAAGNVDLYITAPATDITTVTPNFSNVAFKANTGYVQVPAGSYRVRITPAGSKTVAIDTGTVVLNSGDIRTGIAVGDPGVSRPLTALLLSDN